MLNKTDSTLIAARYVAVWSEPEADRRRAAITGLWANGGVEFVEGTQFRGHAELEARIAHAYAEFVGSGKYTVAHADDVATHGDIVTFTIQLIATSDSELAWAARVFLLVQENTRIQADYQLTVKPLAG